MNRKIPERTGKKKGNKGFKSLISSCGGMLK